MQRPLWMSQIRHRDSPTQNMALLMHIDGPLDSAKLATAFAQVVAAADVLRTRIVDEGGGPGVRLSTEPAVTERTEVARAKAQQWATERVRVPLDMSQCGYDSVVLVHEDGTASWYLDLHHTITDATSSSLVFAATAAAYRGESSSQDSYYEWASTLDASPNSRVDRAIEHWRRRQPATGIGRLYRTPTELTPAAQRLGLQLDSDLMLLAQSRLGADYQMISHDLAWSALLLTLAASYTHRVAGVSEFSLGLPVHNRGDASARTLIGPAMEVFPVDISVTGDDTFRALHKRVSRSLMTTLRHAVPGTAPKADYEAVINVIPRAGVGAFGDWETATTWVHSEAIDSSHLFRLQLTSYGPDATELALDINCGAAAETHRDRAPAHALGLLRAMLVEPDTLVGEVPVCTGDELAAQQRWELGPALSEQPRSVIRMLREGLAENGGVALEDGDREWSGTELWSHAVEIATWLRAQGVVAGSRVGIELARSSDAVLAILGTLLAGGSYVPLDPSQPQARRERLAMRAECVLVLTALPQSAGTSPVHREPTWDEPSPTDEAYLLFTSGSTGQPKGVPISHQGMADYLQFASERYLTADPTPTVPLFSSLSFDLTLTSLFLPLVSGGKSVVIRPDGPEGLAQVAARTDITWCKATPSHLEILIRLLPENHQLATLVVGGEAFGARLAAKLTNYQVFNEYGPTEAVVGCMIHEVDSTSLARQTEVPIGVPAPGVTLRVVNQQLERVPIGSPGELCIAHRGLTPGYLDTTTDRPFVHIDGRRFYRSGDLVRMVDDQTLVYLGRIDEQVKVGGIRLDPIEVEQALVAHPTIRAAAVRLWSPTESAIVQRCARCGLASNVPGVVFDANGACDTCDSYDRIAPAAAGWFKTSEDLLALRAQLTRAKTGKYDCLHLLSGGKDSTYALYKLVEMGFEPYVLTLDNGFISEQALDNVRRSATDLGLDFEITTTDAMNEIFRDSLERYSNVCHGCYKTIYTVATTRAVELGIPAIVTGLSRGQLFETRLIPQQFSDDRFDPDAIDRAVVEARKAYHRVDDAAGRLLNTDVFKDDDLFDRLTFVDFYRYMDVELSHMFRYLDAQAPWVRPTDTGRSTNCLINAAGIHTHLTEQGYHNYAVPYAWDVRLGHKTRQEAIDELDDQLDMDDVHNMLATIDYRPAARQILAAWVELEPDAPEAPSPAELRSFLGSTLPAHFIPAAFVTVANLPMAASGKLDLGALPAPTRVHRPGPAMYVSPESPVEAAIIEVWEQVLGVEPVGVEDDFFALGGDSLLALQMIVLLSARLGATISDELAFSSTTPRRLAARAELRDPDTEPALDVGPAPSSPRLAEPPALSVGEQSVLYDQQAAGTDRSYNVGHLYQVSGAIDAKRFEQALRQVAQAHVPLSWTYGSPRRALSSTAAVEVTVRPQMPADEVGAAAQSAHRKPFDLENGPLLRCLVQPIDTGATAVVLAIHHVSGDAQSLARVWEQVDAVYRGGSGPELPTNYADFTTWQQDQLGDDDRRFWVVEPGTAAPASLAIAAPPRAEDDGFIRRPASFSPSELSAGSRATGFAAALAALSAVLVRYSTGSERVGVGIIASTRNHSTADGLAGYFLNTLPVELDCPRTASLAELVTQAASVVGKSLAHRGYPLAGIVADRRLAKARLPSTNVLLAFDRIESTRLGANTVGHEVLFNGSAVADATFFVEVRDDRVDLSVEYRGSVLVRADAGRLLDDFDAMLGHAIWSQPGSIETLELPSDNTSRLTGPDLAQRDPVLAGILANTRSLHSDLAVTCGDDSLSWQEIGARSAALAGRLQADSVGPGDRVVICLPRSIDLVVAVLAVLRAGASYVPIDPTYPETRRALMSRLAGASAGFVVGGQPPLTRNDIVVTDALMGDEQPGTDVATSATDEAYVIFTSGSTGIPRGVPVSHGQLGASTAARYQAYDTHPGSFLLLSSMSFDSSVAGLFWTLSSGGELVLPTEAEVHDPDALLALFRAGAITHTLLVPTLYKALLERSGGQSQWPGVTIVAGEACSPILVDRHHEQYPTSILVNEYGPTEATVWATSHRCRPGEATTPIGTPIAGAWTDILGHDGSALPSGVAGELAIGGAGLVLGYLDDADATAARFSVSSSGERFFRTGDRAVVVDGEVMFLGRSDDQISVGGVRVEPNEIEMVLCEHRDVSTAVVTVFDPRSLSELMALVPPAELRHAMVHASSAQDPAGALRERLVQSAEPDSRLVAHVETGADVDVDQLRTRAENGLPAALRPAVYVVHERLPRLPNGKVDRQAAQELAVPWPQQQSNGAVSLPGGNTATAAVAAIFGEVLGRNSGPSDSFFDLGGHSLLALRLLRRIDQEFGIELSVASLYQAPTPEGIAAALPSAVSAPTKTQYLVPVQPNGSRPPVFGLHVLGLNAMFYRPLAERLGSDQPVYGLGLTSSASDMSGPTTVREIARAYATEIERARPEGPVGLTAVSMGSIVAVEVANELMSRGREVVFLGLFDAAGPDSARFVPSRQERLKLHMRGLLTNPFSYGTARVRFLGLRIARRVGQTDLAVRKALGAPLPDRAKLREFVEANIDSAGSHRLEPFVGKITVFKAQDDPFSGSLKENAMGWGPYADGGVDIVEVPGGHTSMLEEPHVGRLATEIERAIDWGLELGSSPTRTDDRTGLAAVETDLRAALRDGRFCPAVAHLGSVPETLDSAAVEFVRRADASISATANGVRSQAQQAISALAAVGVTAHPEPIPDRLQHASFAIDIEGPLDAAVDALAGIGYRLQDPLSAGAWRAHVRSHSSVMLISYDDATTRLRLSWAADSSDSRTARVLRPGRADLTAIATPSWAWPAYWAVRPVRLLRDRVVRRRSERDLGVFLGTPSALIGPVLDLAEPTPADLIVDLGCGDGRVLIEAARRYGCGGRGVENDAALVGAARSNVAAAGLQDQIEIVLGDAADVDLTDATVVFAFLPAEITAAIVGPTLAAMAPGGRFVTHEQVATPWSIPPDRSQLIVEGAITVAHLWS